ncbi:hypothetical protein COZ81_01400 [Candidatus Jorgensenbacteria bacterium CG_4_8_14_3_um_filter_38_10]|uniref:Uncharacterized protein n=1 Tax=Candidatus Jorgensenbacteria bacterium CG11_big_fil_rev_8_21_14_0_20_38_23 TaxID=1974594 RepID=A0A2H0NAU7_9BACT|nr:MAG: hypothetical protein COV54_03445 [Candidatus Jorgensenbacteria bacterium CG11_big_fil_rev_8_21_14_0_20_38_23]PIW97661.1 MAG: hypothetical protein COZ81_01400 [Candidatus Jorgensenbacteria bacterium CG_4_8_14_3_um_filter_38_10]
MDTNFQKIKELIQKSALPLAEQENLLLLFTKANDQDLEPTLKLFAEDSSWIHKINENYKAKQAALATGNQALWQKIVQEEEVQLKELER